MATDYTSYFVYTLRRKVFTFAGAKFHIYAPDGTLLLYTKLKAFKLKEDIRIYTGEDMQTEVLRITARQILDISASYDVFDSTSNTKVGALRRKGLKSMIRDEWLLLDASDREIGLIQEDSAGLALVRRFIDAASLFLPQKFIAQMGGAPVGTFQQNMNPFVRKITVDFTPDPQRRLDRRLGLASAILLAAIEGKQS